MNLPLQPRSRRRAEADHKFGIRNSNCGIQSRAAFTMVEVAISIALVSFALVAIIGVLPRGLSVQRENREDTIIYQDATVLMEAIRGGAQSAGMDVLSNNIIWLQAGGTRYSNVNALASRQIVSFLSQNAVTGYFRSFSGSLRDRDTNVSALAFGYLVSTQINPVEVDANTAAASPIYARHLTNNLYDVRLTFQWPVINGKPGNNRLSLRSLVNGTQATDTNLLLFFQSSAFTNAP